MRIETELTIAAPPPVVWRAFLDRGRWRLFSDFLDLDPGRPFVEGSRFWFGLRLGGLVPTPVRVRVIRRVEERELRWVGAGPGVRGEHYFLFEPAGEGWTRFVHGEEFTGPLAGPFLKLAGAHAKEMYAAFNVGLALQVEGVGATSA